MDENFRDMSENLSCPGPICFRHYPDKAKTMAVSGVNRSWFMPDGCRFGMLLPGEFAKKINIYGCRRISTIFCIFYNM